MKVLVGGKWREITSPTIRRAERERQAAFDIEECRLSKAAWDAAWERKQTALSLARRRVKRTDLGESMRLSLAARNGDDITPENRAEWWRRRRAIAQPVVARGTDGELHEYTDKWNAPDYNADSGDISDELD